MARTNADNTQKVYLNIVGGKFAEKAKSDTPNAVKRFSEKKNQDVWELLNDRTSGTIKSMVIEKGDYGKQLIISMSDVDENYLISLPVESKYFDSFCSKIGNANISQSLELAPYSFEPKEGGAKRVGMNIFQGGNKLEYFFSKENPKGKPFPESEKLDEESWKIYKLQERKFYCQFIESLTIKKEEPKASSQPEESDDLPF